MSEYDEYHEDDTADAAHLDRPVDVRVVELVRVQEFPATQFNTGQVKLGLANKPVQIIGGRPQRVSLAVKNKTTSECRIWIGGSDQLSATFGYELDPGEQMSFQMNGALWAVCDTDNPDGEIHWATEDRDG